MQKGSSGGIFDCDADEKSEEDGAVREAVKTCDSARTEKEDRSATRKAQRSRLHTDVALRSQGHSQQSEDTAVRDRWGVQRTGGIVAARLVEDDVALQDYSRVEIERHNIDCRPKLGTAWAFLFG